MCTALQVGMENGAAAMENSMAAPQTVMLSIII